MICDLESLSKLRAGQDLVSGSDGRGRWLLTNSPKGPAWGAMLDSGVRLILPSGTTLGETVEVLSDWPLAATSATTPNARPWSRDGWPSGRTARSC